MKFQSVVGDVCIFLGLTSFPIVVQAGQQTALMEGRRVIVAVMK